MSDDDELSQSPLIRTINLIRLVPLPLGFLAGQIETIEKSHFFASKRSEKFLLAQQITTQQWSGVEQKVNFIARFFALSLALPTRRYADRRRFRPESEEGNELFTFTIVFARAYKRINQKRETK